MQKILLTILFMTMPAYAFENYMIVSELPIQAAKIEDERVAAVTPIFTIENNKQILILTPLKTGVTKLVIKQNETDRYLEINIDDKKTKIGKQNGFQYFSLDTPPKGLDLISPPDFVDIPEPPKARE